MKISNELENKRCIIRKIDDYTVYGTVSFDEHGIWLKTNTETSFIAYNNIKEIRLDKRGE
ncbi:MAG: hypothetical protein GF317_15320 [Candidatus Lokiarchaeota archaeon]|nr:hypothetical protein [Candidatus Lokiarchaeota archaeon]